MGGLELQLKLGHNGLDSPSNLFHMPRPSHAIPYLSLTHLFALDLFQHYEETTSRHWKV